MAVDPNYITKNYERQGGDQWDVGGVLDILSGGALKVAGVDRTSALATAPAAVAAGYKIARGQHTTVTASDTVVTGLATVVMVVATLDSDPGDDPLFATASIGNQTNAPAAGSVYIKTWKTDGADPTPSAATTFTKKVNWFAIGT